MTGKKIKAAADPVHAMNAYRRSEGIASVTLNLGTRWVLGGVTPRPGRLTSGETPKTR
jgi:hypothetical protein